MLISFLLNSQHGFLSLRIKEPHLLLSLTDPLPLSVLTSQSSLSFYLRLTSRSEPRPASISLTSLIHPPTQADLEKASNLFQAISSVSPQTNRSGKKEVTSAFES